MLIKHPSFATAKPEAPKNLEVTKRNKNSVGLKWAKPAKDGGSAITAYVIEKKDVQRGNWSTASSVSPDVIEFTVPKLTEGNQYMFRVTAENDVGVSSPVETSQPVTAKSPYSK